MHLEPASVVIVIGNRGEGKSYWVQHHVVDKAQRCIVWSPHTEGRRPDYPGIERLDLGSLIAMPEQLTTRDAYKVAITGEWKTTLDAAEDFEDFCEAVHALAEADAKEHEQSQRIPFVLIVDECGILLTPVSGRTPPWIWLETLATQSRHWGWGVPLVLAGQRAKQMRPSVRNQADTVISFWQPNGPDIRALVETCGDEAEIVPTLEPHKSYVWTRAKKRKGSENG